MFRCLFSVMLLCVVGCNSPSILFQNNKPGPVPTPPTPTPLSEDAAACLSRYGKSIADAFDHAADGFDRHESSLSIIKRMGDELEPARIESFMPPMQALTDAAPKRGATDEERQSADLHRARMLRTWATQLRGGKTP